MILSASIASAARHAFNALASTLRNPPRWVQGVGVASAVLLVANVLWHGAQPYAVGFVPNGWDKLAHATLHFALCGTLLFVFGLRRGWWAVAVCAIFAAVDEWAQQFNPGRSVEFADWLASLIGAVLCLAAAHALAWRAEMNRLKRAQWMRQSIARWLRQPP